MNSLEAIIPISIFIIVGWVFKVISDNRVRQRLIDKGLVDENVKYLFIDKESRHRLSSLKWGLVSLAIGLAFLLGQLFSPEMSDEMTVSGIFIFAGIGFLVYYNIAGKIIKSGEDEQAS